jgi:plastocyanin
MYPTRKTFSRAASLPLAALALASGATGAATVVAAAPASASTSATTVKATETDFHIALSKSSFKPGRYSFDAVNKGHTTHALMITGPGIRMAMTKDIQPGQSATLAVTLKKGTYDVFCPIPGHKALGMNLNINVGGAATAASKSSGSGTSGGSTAGSGGASF